jgi:phosphoribosylformimino-5-aminoimidazole carboxamide ribotide isomerase
MEWDADPATAAERWQEEGVEGLHVIDLDRALGSGSNEAVIISLLKEAKIPVQVGGGIRSPADALTWIDRGAARVVLGTMAYTTPEGVTQIIQKTGPRGVAIAVDFRENTTLTNGWRQNTGMGLYQAVESVEKLGVDTVIVTAADRDGTGTGPDFDTYRNLRKKTQINLLASGGIRSNEDVLELRSLGFDGAIVGRALYEGAVRPAELKQKL